MSMPKVLITGITGQDGSYLAALYIGKGWEVHGTIRARSDLSYLEAISDHPNLHLHMEDIRDPHGVVNLVQKTMPDVIHHLAAMTYVPYSWENPHDTFETNVQGTINILEAARQMRPMPKVQFASSSEIYGAVPMDETPITENTNIYAASPYGISKYTGDLLCQQYHRSYGVPTIITRAFNHESPRRGKHFVSTQIVKQALEIRYKQRKHFTLGNTDAIRDFSDARDIVEAYTIAVDKAIPGIPYNICSEKGYSIKEIVDIVAEITQVNNHIEQDPARMRPSDAPNLIGSCKRFRAATGWQAKAPFTETLRWMVETLETEMIKEGKLKL